MPFVRFLIPLLAALLMASGVARAQATSADHVEAELVAAADAIQPGQPVTLALRLKHDPHWHTYWQVPGDSGLPTRIEWQLPAGWTAGPVQWPVPKRLPIGPLMKIPIRGPWLASGMKAMGPKNPIAKKRAPLRTAPSAPPAQPWTNNPGCCASPSVMKSIRDGSLPHHCNDWCAMKDLNLQPMD